MTDLVRDAARELFHAGYQQALEHVRDHVRSFAPEALPAMDRAIEHCQHVSAAVQAIAVLNQAKEHAS